MKKLRLGKDGAMLLSIRDTPCRNASEITVATAKINIKNQYDNSCTYF
jgi:hypothetical protein